VAELMKSHFLTSSLKNGVKKCDLSVVLKVTSSLCKLLKTKELEQKVIKVSIFSFYIYNVNIEEEEGGGSGVWGRMGKLTHFLTFSLLGFLVGVEYD
jgi:hypothetical protein